MKFTHHFNKNLVRTLIVSTAVIGVGLALLLPQNRKASAQEVIPDPQPHVEATSTPCPSFWNETGRTAAKFDFVCQNAAAVIKVTTGAVHLEKTNSCSGNVEDTKNEVLSYSVSGPTEITYPPEEPDGLPDGPYDQYIVTPTRNGVPEGDPETVIAPAACDICPH